MIHRRNARMISRSYYVERGWFQNKYPKWISNLEQSRIWMSSRFIVNSIRTDLQCTRNLPDSDLMSPFLWLAPRFSPLFCDQIEKKLGIRPTSRHDFLAPEWDQNKSAKNKNNFGGFLTPIPNGFMRTRTLRKLHWEKRGPMSLLDFSDSDFDKSLESG